MYPAPGLPHSLRHPYHCIDHHHLSRHLSRHLPLAWPWQHLFGQMFSSWRACSAGSLWVERGVNNTKLYSDNQNHAKLKTRKPRYKYLYSRKCTKSRETHQKHQCKNETLKKTPKTHTTTTPTTTTTTTNGLGDVASSLPIQSSLSKYNQHSHFCNICKFQNYPNHCMHDNAP
jgi:hypothetical protein